MTTKEKPNKIFKEKLTNYADFFNKTISTQKGDWIVKGFIDIAKNIYTISIDTKVVSKIMELLLFPEICKFAEENHYRMVLSKEQNHYPDISFIDKDGNKFALDIKSTYRKNKNNVNGMTLGAFTGYFRDRKSNKNITFPYNDYSGHFVLGIIYSRSEEAVDERKTYKIENLENIVSVVKDFKFFVQEKYKIASGTPGSGNTKNIGSIRNVNKLVKGEGPFADLGEKTFDDYWMYYLTKDMAKSFDLPKSPYKNLEEYKTYKGK